MLHLKIKPFIVSAKNWSGEVSYNDISRCLSFEKIKVVCHKHDVNTHYILEPDEFTLGTLSVSYLSILSDLTSSLIVIDPWTFTIAVIFNRTS